MDTTLLNHKILDRLPLPLEEFMEIVMYDAEGGYYSQSSVIGKQHDFITAPEISPLFSHCLAQWCIDQWLNMGKPTPVNLIELGAGQGTMLKDMLSLLQSAPDFFHALTPTILEKSPTLISTQRATLKDYPNVKWISSLEAIEKGYSIILANEFFDALPIQYYRSTAQGLEQAMVTDLSQISWTKVNNPLFPPSNQSIYFQSRAYKIFADQITNLFHKTGGFGLIIDYGNEAPGFTLQAIKNHKKIGIFEELGKSDLTHHVDFCYLKSLFIDQEVKVLGPINQSDFLKEIGIVEALENLKVKLSAKAYLNHTLALHRLIGTAEMGELFKVMAIQGGSNGR